MFNFKGKTILVTGGAQGIGKETARGIVEGGRTCRYFRY